MDKNSKLIALAVGGVTGVYLLNKCKCQNDSDRSNRSPFLFIDLNKL